MMGWVVVIRGRPRADSGGVHRAGDDLRHLGRVVRVGERRDSVPYVPDYALFFVLGEAVGVMVAIAIGMYMLSRTRAGKTLILQSSQQANAGWVAHETDRSLLGATGEVYSALRPAGMVMIDGKRIDAVSDGAFIDKGKRSASSKRAAAAWWWNSGRVAAWAARPFI